MTQSKSKKEELILDLMEQYPNSGTYFTSLADLYDKLLEKYNDIETVRDFLDRILNSAHVTNNRRDKELDNFVPKEEVKEIVGEAIRTSYRRGYNTVAKDRFKLLEEDNLLEELLSKHNIKD